MITPERKLELLENIRMAAHMMSTRKSAFRAPEVQDEDRRILDQCLAELEAEEGWQADDEDRFFSPE